ncbi:hypothetical protein C8R48DRAFT_677541 [Suillus tomentosus]|nr:hypothetical protein C8R48DRAFT_677541 [Suillus tomentosus]
MTVQPFALCTKPTPDNIAPSVHIRLAVISLRAFPEGSNAMPRWRETARTFACGMRGLRRNVRYRAMSEDAQFAHPVAPSKLAQVLACCKLSAAQLTSISMAGAHNPSDILQWGGCFRVSIISITTDLALWTAFQRIFTSSAIKETEGSSQIAIQLHNQSHRFRFEDNRHMKINGILKNRRRWVFIYLDAQYMILIQLYCYRTWAHGRINVSSGSVEPGQPVESKDTCHMRVVPFSYNLALHSKFGEIWDMAHAREGSSGILDYIVCLAWTWTTDKAFTSLRSLGEAG